MFSKAVALVLLLAESYIARMIPNLQFCSVRNHHNQSSETTFIQLVTVFFL